MPRLVDPKVPAVDTVPLSTFLVNRAHRGFAYFNWCGAIPYRYSAIEFRTNTVSLYRYERGIRAVLRRKYAKTG